MKIAALTYLRRVNPFLGLLGCAARLGDVVTQDRAYSIEVVLKVIQMYEDQFQQEGYNIPIRFS